MAAPWLPEDSYRLLADPSQEVLIERRPALRQLAPVPLRRLGTDPSGTAEPDRRSEPASLRD